MWCRRLVFTTFNRQYHSKASLLDDLTQRGFIQDLTRRDALDNALRTKPQTVYAGVDPTAKALHIGHLIPFMCLLHFQVHGHRIIPLIGGATGRIGDPSGRLTERQQTDIKELDDNVASLTSSVRNFFQRALLYTQSRVGFHENIDSEPWGALQSKYNDESGQCPYPFRFTTGTVLHGVYISINVGGSDQWGNIVAGLELINKLKPVQDASDVYGITTPLLTTSTGEKFGKSAGNAVWLDSNLTSVFDFYQYFLKVTDADVEKNLKLFTLLPLEEIETIVQAHTQNPELRVAQHRLASEVTELVHEKSGLARATVMTNLVFGSDYSKLKAENIVSAFENDPRLVKVTKQELFETPVIKLAARYSLVSSNSVARNLVSSKGLYLNNRVIQDTQFKITETDLLDNQIVVIRAGKDKLLILVGSLLSQ